MLYYFVRRFVYAMPILLAVNIVTFLLFFAVNSPDDMARAHLGNKYITEKALTHWKQTHGYDLPLLYNSKTRGFEHFTKTLFFSKSLSLFAFHFGVSDAGRDISVDIKQRMGPSLLLAIPILLVGVVVNIIFSLLLAFFKGTYLDFAGVTLCVILMSVSILFYIIGGQFLFGKMLKLVPISGYRGDLDAFKFIILPVVIAVVGGLGAGTRWYQTLMLEEVNKDYVRTAKAKGLNDFRIFFLHILKNALIPILTGVVVIIPSLFLGSLLLESFFGIPGLGSYTIDAIQQQDFAIVRVMVFLGTVFYILGLLLTDFSYTFVDPRILLE
ncbi:MAG: ABC transporter permease [Gammaproteobacteria bacterium]